MSSYSGRHSSDVVGAKAVGWLPRSDGKLLLMCWVGCQVLALLVREEVGGCTGEGAVQKGGHLNPVSKCYLLWE